MDIKKLAKECGAVLFIDGEDNLYCINFRPSDLELFAQKIIAARDAEWRAELVGYVNPAVINSLSNKWNSTTTITTHVAFNTDVALYIQPKEVQ